MWEGEKIQGVPNGPDILLQVAISSHFCLTYLILQKQASMDEGSTSDTTK